MELRRREDGAHRRPAGAPQLVPRQHRPGLWTDIEPYQTDYVENYLSDNTRSGIKHEISFDATITRNTAAYNGSVLHTRKEDIPRFDFEFNPGSDVFQSTAGIFVSTSRGVDVTGNHVRYNRNGIVAARVGRGTTVDVPGNQEDERELPTRSSAPRIDVTDADVGGAGELREVLWRAENDLADGRDLGAAQVAALNRAATGPGLVPTLDERQRRAWPAPVTGSRVVTEVARDAVATFGGPLRDRVPRCAGDRCALVFMDTSRPGARRWCSMQRCGGREKSRAFRDRGRTGLEGRGTE